MSAFQECMTQVVCFPMRKELCLTEEVLAMILAPKKRTFGVEMLNGYGGKVEWGLNPLIERCMRRICEMREVNPEIKVGDKLLAIMERIRDFEIETNEQGMIMLNGAVETLEECGVEIFLSSMIRRGNISITFQDGKIISLHIFTFCYWLGNFSETEEMGKPETFYIRDPLKDIPIARMLHGDRIWIHKVAAGEYFHAEMSVDKKGFVTYLKFL